MDVSVVGAGIIGASAAFHLSRLGARVTVLDATHAPRGASAATFGWINANGKQPDHYFELNRAGMAEHTELADLLGDQSWLHAGGSLEWSDAEGMDSLHTRVEDLAARGYAAQMVDRSRIRELEPSLVTDGITLAAFFESEGWADTVGLVGLLLSAARENGARLLLGTRVTAVEPASGGQPQVTTDETNTHTADVVVNCAGADAGFFLRLSGITVDTAGPPGLNAVTASTELRLNRVVRAPGAHFRPETGGRLMIASPASDKALADTTDVMDLSRRNLEVASQYLPSLAAVDIDEARVARRAIPADGLPVVGRTADAPWLYHVVTHSGVTLAPVLGRLVAAEIINETEDGRLQPYRPGRFVGSLSS